MIDPALFAELAAIEREWAALTEDDDGDGDANGTGRHRTDVGAVKGRTGVNPGMGVLAGGRSGGGGNPNHDPANGQFTSGGGGGKHARRKRRLRHRLRREHAALKGRHRAERRELAARQRERHAAHRAHYGARLAKAKARKEITLRKADARHEREIAAMERRRERERAKEKDDSPEQVQEWEDRHAKDVASAREAYRTSERPAHERMAEFDVGVVRHEREQAAAELKGRHERQRQGMLRRQRAERAELRERAAAHGFRFKGAKGGSVAGQRGALVGVGGLRDGAGLDDDPGPWGRDTDGGMPDPAQVRRLHPGRTHKAGSAESILKHCLRSLGLTAAFRRGEVTGRRSLEVLEAVRQYARDWLRHEAEQLIRQYGRAVDADAGADRGSGDDVPGGDLPRPAPGAADRGTGVVGGPAGAEVARSLSDAMRHHVGRFFRRARNFVREAILAGSMAVSGPEEMSTDDLADADRAAQVQVAYLDRFEADVAARPPAELAEPSGVALAEPMTAREFAARAEMYGNAAWTTPLNADRRKIILRATGHVPLKEQRFHLRRDPEFHACKTCLAASNAGVVPVGTLPDIGDSECLNNCDCYFTYLLPDGATFITSRGWRRAA